VLPPPVLAPRPASGVDGAVGFGTSYGFATATLRSPDGQEVRITGNGENTSVGNDNAAAVSGLFPAFAALRLATDGADAAAYIHWQRVGVNTRFEVASWDQQALGLRLAGSTDFRARAYDGSLAVEHVLPEVSGFQPFISRAWYSVARITSSSCRGSSTLPPIWTTEATSPACTSTATSSAAS
jgi:hypothetical protein